MKKIFLISLVLMLSASFLFGADFGLKQIRPKIGVIMPEDPWDTGFLAGLEINIGNITPEMRLMPLLTYWKSNYDNTIADFSLSNIQLGADVHYMLTNVRGLYFGGGLSMNLIKFEFPYYFYDGTTKTKEDTDSKIGFDFLSGFELPIGNMSSFVEFKYNIVDNLNSIELSLGLNFDLNK